MMIKKMLTRDGDALSYLVSRRVKSLEKGRLCEVELGANLSLYSLSS